MIQERLDIVFTDSLKKGRKLYRSVPAVTSDLQNVCTSIKKKSQPALGLAEIGDCLCRLAPTFHM